MPYHAANRIARSEHVAGVIIIPRRLPVIQVINDLEIIVSCSDMDERESVIKYLPLQVARAWAGELRHLIYYVRATQPASELSNRLQIVFYRKCLTGSVVLSYTRKVARSPELRTARKNFQ